MIFTLETTKIVSIYFNTKTTLRTREKYADRIQSNNVLLLNIYLLLARLESACSSNDEVQKIWGNVLAVL